MFLWNPSKCYRSPAITITSCNCRMTALRNQGKYDGVFDLMLRLCRSIGYPFPDRVSYNIVIDALGKARQFEMMESAFMSMLSAGFSPDVRTFTSMVHAYANSRRGVEALGVLETMDRLGIEPNVCTYTVVERWVFGTHESHVFVFDDERVDKTGAG